MSILGNNISPSNRTIVTDTGDGSDATVTLTKDLGSDDFYDVYIDGQYQDPIINWTRSGTTLTFTIAPSNGANIRVIQYGERLDINTPADGTVDYTKLVAGTVIGVDQADFSEYTSHTTVITNDDTLLTSSSGEQLTTTLAYTPKSATSKLIIEAKIMVVGSGAIGMTSMLFRDSETNPIAGDYLTVSGAGFSANLVASAEITASSIVEQTFKIRVGPTSGTMYVNGSNTARLFNVTPLSYIRITEVKA